MTGAPTGKGVMAQASLKLARLNAAAEAARVRLAGLQAKVEAAENRLSEDRSAEIVEANENLVLSMLGAMTNAVDIRQKLQEVSEASEHDPLTELPNRMLLLDRFTRAIANAKRRNSRLALMFVDIDNFKQINDTLGHAVGDEVLKLVADCLSTAVRDADTVSRHGGDEFLVLLTEVSQPSDAALVAQKVIAALAAARRIEDYGLEITASIGISIYPVDGTDPETLIARADVAMYRTKKLGQGGFAFHGQTPIAGGRKDPLVPEWLMPPVIDYELELASLEALNAHLREANEQLLVAALGAQALHAAAELAHRRQVELMAVVAHELRNPLTPIRTAAALLGQMGAPPPRTSSPASRHRASGGTHGAAGRRPARRVTRRHRQAENRAAGNRPGRCHPHFGGQLPYIDGATCAKFNLDIPGQALTVSGDAVRLTQVFTNLLDNASKYTPDRGEIGLSVSVADNAVVITVADNGIGIAPEILPNVFEPFIQHVQAIGFNGVGLGIGLTVVRELVEAHGGSVLALSEGSGLGSRFVVTLSLIEPALPEGGTV